MKPRSIVIIGRLWFDRVNGNTYHSAQVLADGVPVAIAPFQYGYGDQWQYSAAEALEKAELMPGREHHSNGSAEPLWSWCRRQDIAFNYTSAHCTKRECVAFGAATVIPARLGASNAPGKAVAS